jgi:hypothetical protein
MKTVRKKPLVTMISHNMWDTMQRDLRIKKERNIGDSGNKKKFTWKSAQVHG